MAKAIAFALILASAVTVRIAAWPVERAVYAARAAAHHVARIRAPGNIVNRCLIAHSLVLAFGAGSEGEGRICLR